MKKQLLCLFLVLCTVFSVLPFVAAPAAAAEEAGETDYSALYVQDGLTVFLTAFTKEEAAAALSAGAWASKVGTVSATLNGTAWKVGETGGLHYDLATRDQSVSLSFDMSVLPAGDYTVEMVAIAPGLTVEADGKTPLQTPNQYGYQVGAAFAFGPLKMEGFPIERDPESDFYNTGNQYAYNELRPFYLSAQKEWMDSAPYGYGISRDTSFLYNGHVLTYTVTLDVETTGGATKATYAMFKNGTSTMTFDIPRKAGNSELAYIPNAEDQSFHLFRSFPATVYAVRVYDRVLSAAEQKQNHFADLASYLKLDVSVLKEMSEGELTRLYDAFATLTLDCEKATAENLLKSLSAKADVYDPETSLYVTQGLTVLMTAFQNSGDSLMKLGEGQYLWANQVTGKYTALTGSVWEVGEMGGIGYRQTPAQWNAGHDNGLVLDFGLLPTGDYTVETVVNPVGLTNEDGTRYIDDQTTYGTYLDNGFAFGPFRAMTFVCMRPKGKDGQMEHRWVYVKQGCWQEAKFSATMTDYAFGDTDGKKAVSFVVTHHVPAEGSSEYAIWDNYMKVGSKRFDGSYYIKREDCDGMFRLMYGIPCTLYAVRVYDRVLSASEMLQNHMADLVYYYGLDTTLLRQALSFSESPLAVYRMFKDMSFDLTKEEAEEEYVRNIGRMFLDTLGVSVRLDEQVGVRGVFKLDLGLLKEMEKVKDGKPGWNFEVGVLVNLGEGAAPTMTDSQNKLIVYENGAKQDSYFLDESGTFAVAVQYTNPTLEMKLTDVQMAAYMIMTREVDGKTERLEVLLPVSDDAFSAFTAYYERHTSDYSSNKFFRTLVNSCYEDVQFTVEEDGDDTADGKTAPLATLGEAMKQVMKLLGEAKIPMNVTVTLGEGVHRLTETVMLDGTDIAYPYYRFTLKGGDAESTAISSNIELDSGKFTKNADGLLVYQFEQDADGNYPEFRYLYVDGKIATPSHGGSTRYAEGDQLKTISERTFDAKQVEGEITGDVLKTKHNAKNKFYLHAFLFENATAADLEQMELHIESQWDFNIIHVDHVDMEDSFTYEDVKYVAVYFDEEERNHFAIPDAYSSIGRSYWMENALCFVDEPGEYYYDLSTGTLYYCPEEGKDAADYTFAYPTLDNLIKMVWVRNITVDGLTFTGADDLFLSENGHTGGQAGSDSRFVARPNGSFPDRAALFVDYAYGFSITSCIFDNLGCEALSMRSRLENVTVDSCQFFDIGATAIRMANGVANWDETNGNLNTVITNNYINNAAVFIRQCCATQFGSSKNFEMTYNTILNSSYTAISIGWRWSEASWQRGDVINLDGVEIASNYIADFMTDLKDGGAIYTLGGNAENSYSEYFNLLHDNYVVFTKRTGCNGMVNGLYHDGASSNWHTYDNIIAGKSATSERDLSHYIYIYIQHIDSQLAHNVFAEGNVIFNIKATEKEAQVKEVYRTYIVAERYIYEADTVYLADPDEIANTEVSDRIGSTGSSFCPPDWHDVLDNDY